MIKFIKLYLSIFLLSMVFVMSASADMNGKLHSAAAFGNAKTVAMLINKGADINSTDEDGSTALDGAAINGNEKTAAMLIAMGADVNTSDVDGWSPLHYAVSPNSQNYIIASLLIANGADVNASDNRGTTPLGMARDSKNLYLIKLLEQ